MSVNHLLEGQARVCESKIRKVYEKVCESHIRRYAILEYLLFALLRPGYFDLTASQAPPPYQKWTPPKIDFFDVSDDFEEKKFWKRGADK